MIHTTFRFAAFLAFWAIASLVSCKKDDDNNPNPPDPIPKKLVKYWDTAYGDTVTIGYDVLNRVVRVENFEEIQTLAYTGTVLLNFTEFRKNENRTVADVEFTLDDLGRVGTGSGNISYNINNPATTQYVFLYNSEGYMTQKTDMRSDGNTYIYEYTYANGDLVTVKWYTNGALTFREEYEYYTDKEDKIGLDYERFLSVCKNITGQPNRHLLKKARGLNGAAGTLSWEYANTYTLDTDGYPTQMQIKRIDTGDTNTIFYVYE